MSPARRASDPSELPRGFEYAEEFLSPEEEASLLELFQGLPFHAFEYQGFQGKRRVVEYGWEYDFSRRKASEAQQMPDFLRELRGRVAAFAGEPVDDFVEAIVTEYPVGAPIGWHRDVPQFEVIVGISLASACWMRFKPYQSTGKIVYKVLKPRSIYVIRGEARWKWQHSIPPVPEVRYSITFRTLGSGW